MPFSETKKNKGRHTTAQGNLSQLAQPTSNPTDNLNQKQSQPNKPQEEVVHTENHSQQQLNKKNKIRKKHTQHSKNSPRPNLQKPFTTTV
jgi:hypothetical protein